MKYKAAIFDLDGTLLNSIDDLADSCNNALEKLGFPTHTIECYKVFVGDGMRKLVERSLPEDSRDEETLAKCFAEMREQYSRAWAVKSKPYAGILEMLKKLEQTGMKLAVLSNKPDDFTKLCVDRFLQEIEFTIVCGVCPDRPAKPDPTGALAIANEFGVAPKDIIYLGDTNTDMQTANTAGMFAVGAIWGFRTKSELEEFGAHKTIEHPSEFICLAKGSE